MVCKGAGEAHRQAETAWREAVLAASSNEERLASVRAQCEALLQGQDLRELRVQAEALASRENRLQTLYETAVKMEETAGRIDLLNQGRIAAENRRDDLFPPGGDLDRGIRSP